MDKQVRHLWAGRESNKKLLNYLTTNRQGQGTPANQLEFTYLKTNSNFYSTSCSQTQTPGAYPGGIVFSGLETNSHPDLKS